MVRAELAEISELQEDVYGNVFEFYRMDKDQKIKHVNLLQKLLEKQRVLYTRMSLSDDPEAKEMKERIVDSAKMMGLQEGMDISYMFGNMEKLLETMKEEIDKQS
jgi:hypothetical protein|tara:strand:+ start:1618 stop:1932 length:315 start_codon:yes stop_codon:yes gene_type:complete